MRRSEIDGELWTIPGTRTKNHGGPVSSRCRQWRGLDRVARRRTSCSRLPVDRRLAAGRSEARMDAHHGEGRAALGACTTFGGQPPPGWQRSVSSRTSSRRSSTTPRGSKAGVAGIYNRATICRRRRRRWERWAAHVEGLVSGKSGKLFLWRPEEIVKPLHGPKKYWPKGDPRRRGMPQ